MKIVKYFFILLIVFIILFTAWFLLPNKYFNVPYKYHLVDEFFANRGYYLACDKIPSHEEVQKIIDKNKADIDSFQKIHGESIDLRVEVGKDYNREICPGKSAVKFLVYSSDQRKIIEKKYGENFYGIPYEIINM